jgi:methionyl-tRNA formyltransferase
MLSAQVANERKCVWEAGVPIYLVNEKIDAGDPLRKQVLAIDPKESLDRLLRRSTAIAADLLIEDLQPIERRHDSWADAAAIRRPRSEDRVR